MGSFSWAGLAVERDRTNKAIRKRRIIFFGAKGGCGTTKKGDLRGSSKGAKPIRGGQGPTPIEEGRSGKN
jgi:hypothetical protein